MRKSVDGRISMSRVESLACLFFFFSFTRLTASFHVGCRSTTVSPKFFACSYDSALPLCSGIGFESALDFLFMPAQGDQAISLLDMFSHWQPVHPDPRHHCPEGRLGTVRCIEFFPSPRCQHYLGQSCVLYLPRSIPKQLRRSFFFQAAAFVLATKLIAALNHQEIWLGLCRIAFCRLRSTVASSPSRTFF
ncbi:hypothetical protein F5Y17DRAFT_129860 [Xylariaceae sp. FL0594]|nr:hypothetical protein F5Y17DRAFT_129860 [Xylariaceae sp. FL0594]